MRTIILITNLTFYKLQIFDTVGSDRKNTRPAKIISQGLSLKRKKTEIGFYENETHTRAHK